MKSNPKNEVRTNRILLSSKSPFSVREAYKTLRTNVIFSLPGNDSKCIGVTSSDRGEGKSTLGINLAISLAQLNKKVVILDCDMRLPTIAAKVNLKVEEGLSNYLSGMIKEIPVYHMEKSGIDIIPSGTIPPDPTSLIDSQEMRNLVLELKKAYDYILFDYPPINIVTDAVILTDMMDGYLIAVRHEYSQYQKITELLRQMQFAEAKILGMVYTCNIEEKKYYKKGKYGSNYYYSKSYGK